MKILIKINAWVLVLGAILTITNNPLGSFVFFCTCVIGLAMELEKEEILEEEIKEIFVNDFGHTFIYI